MEKTPGLEYFIIWVSPLLRSGETTALFFLYLKGTGKGTGKKDGKVRKMKVGVKGGETPNPDEKEVVKTF